MTMPIPERIRILRDELLELDDRVKEFILSVEETIFGWNLGVPFELDGSVQENGGSCMTALRSWNPRALFARSLPQTFRANGRRSFFIAWPN